jgi:pimeloyl-ACP methyl ester carboxylesterase
MGRPWSPFMGRRSRLKKFTDEVQGLYRRMDCPVTVLWGEKDAWIPYEKGEALAALISDRPCVRIRNAGHLVQEDRPEAIVAAVLKQSSF